MNKEEIYKYVEAAAIFMEGIGILILMGGVIYFLIKTAFIRKENMSPFKYARQEIGRTILLGLEILIAADIISTIIHKSDLKVIYGLAIIVLIRTLLSFSISTEIDEKFPWQKKSTS